MQCFPGLSNARGAWVQSTFDPTEFFTDNGPFAKKSIPKKVVLVTLPVGGDASTIESRLRARYAVVSGLGASEFVPADANHLGVVAIHTGDHVIPELIPFEVFQRLERSVPDESPDRSKRSRERKRERETVMVIWVREAYMTENPVQQVAIIHEAINDLFKIVIDDDSTPSAAAVTVSSGGDADEHSSRTTESAPLKKTKPMSDRLPDWTVIGPWSSDLLARLVGDPAMRQSRKKNTSDSPMGWPKGIRRIYSPWATAPDSYIGMNEEVEKAPQIIRVGCTDEVLIAQLIDELNNRQVCPRTQRVLLVSEWDTIYGRSMVAEFRKQYAARHKLIGGGAVETGRGEAAQNAVKALYYARGLDGEADSAQPLVARAKPPGGDKNIPAIAGASDSVVPAPRIRGDTERPEGRSQIDYLRRAAEELRRSSSNWMRDDLETAPITAIGVMGTDIYDKLVILQALRPVFPDAIFFTTDLDARFMHETEIAYTRNLVVSSPFGLRLSERHQRDIPPFRRTYQTATFLATRAAVDDKPIPGQEDGSDTYHDLASRMRGYKPLLFEVGRRSAIELQPVVHYGVEHGKDGHDVDAAQSAAPRPHPPLNNWTARFQRWFFWYVGLVAVLFLLTLRFSLRFRKAVTQEPAERHRWCGALWCVVLFVLVMFTPAILVLFIQRVAGGPGGEPLNYQEGVSVWPTVMLRFGAAALALAMIVYLEHKYRNNWRDLEERFKIPTAKSLRRVRWGAWHRRLLLSWVVEGSYDLRNNIWMGKDARKRFKAMRPRRRNMRIFFNVFFGVRDREEAMRDTEASSHEPKRKLSGDKGFGQTRADRRDDEASQAIDLCRLIRRYYWLNHPLNRAIRVAAVFLVFMAYALLWFQVWPNAQTPARGSVAFALSDISIGVAIVLFWLLGLLVLDGVQISRWLSRRLSQHRTRWNPELLSRRSKATGVGTRYVCELLDVQFIGRLTHIVGGAIYMPAIVFVMLLASRMRYFDNWHVSPSLMIVIGTFLFILLFCALECKRGAERARQRCLTRVQTYSRFAKSPEEEIDAADDPTTPVARRNRRQAEIVTSDIMNVHDGAFMWILRGPIVGAVLTVLGGYSVLSLLQYLAAT